MKRWKKVLPLVLSAGILAGSMITVSASDLEDAFDAEYYASQYEDLQKAYVHDAGALLEHYIVFGMDEGRQAFPFLNLVKYREVYRDLEDTFGDDWVAYLTHYLTYGAKEGRKSFAKFDAHAYADRYPDLKEAFGYDVTALFNHYVKHGKYEHRNAMNQEEWDRLNAAESHDDTQVQQGTENLAHPEDEDQPPLGDENSGTVSGGDVSGGDAKLPENIYESTDRLYDAWKNYAEKMLEAEAIGAMTAPAAPEFAGCKPSIEPDPGTLVLLPYLHAFLENIPEGGRTQQWCDSANLYNFMALSANLNRTSYNANYEQYNSDAQAYDQAVSSYFGQYEAYIIQVDTYNSYVDAAAEYDRELGMYLQLKNALTEDEQKKADEYLMVMASEGGADAEMLLKGTGHTAELTKAETEARLLQGTAEENLLNAALDAVSEDFILLDVGQAVTLQGTFYSDIVYSERENAVMDIYVPENTENVKGAILFAYGGAWTSGDKKDMVYQCVDYANKGYVTAALNYRFLDGEKIVRENSAHGMLDDIQDSIVKFKDFTDDLGIHLEKLGLMGSSSGAHIATLFSYTRADQSAIPLAFVASQVGPSLFNLENWGGIYGGDGAAYILSGLMGREITAEELANPTPEIQKELDAISPAAHITADSVPTLAIYGRYDTTVDPKNGEVTQLMLTLTGNPAHKFFWAENSGHILEKDLEIVDQYYAELDRFCQEYLGEMKEPDLSGDESAGLESKYAVPGESAVKGQMVGTEVTLVKSVTEEEGMMHDVEYTLQYQILYPEELTASFCSCGYGKKNSRRS